MVRQATKNRKSNPKPALSRSRKRIGETSAEAIQAAEDVALAAFASGLRLAAAFGTVAAKTTSFALVSLASGADKFSELVQKEALGSKNHRTPPKNRQARRRSLEKKPLRR